ncbi:MAG: hypothetical protein RLZ55_1396, partial [Actinomycetota bacterium]
IGGYEAAERIADEWQEGRRDLAELIGAAERNIAITESSTAGLHKVLSTVPLRPGGRVLVAGSEYASTVLPLLQLSRRIGLRVEFIPDNADGVVDTRALAHRLDEDVRLVCAVHAPSHNGLINDIAAIGSVLRLSDSPAWFMVDACQSIGQIPIDATTIGCDFLVASGRKFLRGPRGTGLLFAGDRALRELDAYPVDIRGARWAGTGNFTIAETATRFETFERSVAAGLGLMAAVRYALDIGVAPLGEAIARNAEYLRSRISGLPGWQVLDRGTRHSGIVVARHNTASPAMLVERMRRERVNAHLVDVSTSPRDLADQPALRLSPHAYNNQYDLDRALNLLADLTN